METTGINVGNFLKYKGKLCIVTDSCDCTIRVRIDDSIDGAFIVSDLDFIETIDISKDVLSCTNLRIAPSDKYKTVYYLSSDLYLMREDTVPSYHLANWQAEEEHWNDGDYWGHTTEIKSLNQLQNQMLVLEEDFKIDLQKLIQIISKENDTSYRII